MTTKLLQLSDQYGGQRDKWLPWTGTWHSHYSSLNGHRCSSSLATLLAHLKHAVKILRCFSHKVVPSFYSHPVFMQWVFKTQLQNFTFILSTFHLVSRQQDSLLGYLVSYSVFITLAYNCNICRSDKHVLPTPSNLLMKIMGGTFGSLCRNALGSSTDWHRDIYQ